MTAPAKTPLEALLRARAGLSDPAKWIKNAFFARPEGEDESSEHAAAYYKRALHTDCASCAMGAVWRAIGVPPLALIETEDERDGYELAQTTRNALNFTLQLMPGRFPNIESFNDYYATTHGDVLRAFDMTITRLSAAQEKETA
jgi:hypothetical protein